MPIKGISEKKRLPRLGKIHLGVKKTKEVNGKTVEYPSSTDYFVCPPEVQKVFGEKPKELHILIPVENEERWCSQYYRCYSSKRGLICKGDGETCIRLVDKNTGALADHDSKEVELREMTCEGRDCPDYERQCREIMNLQFLLPEVPGLGIWQIDTSSINSIRNINAAAELIRQIYKHIAMVPLLLTLEPQEVQTPEGERRVVHVLNLGSNQTLLGLMEKMRQPLGIMAPADIELPESDTEVPELIIPQNQEEKATKTALEGTVIPPGKQQNKPAPEKKDTGKTKSEPPVSKTQESAQQGKTTPDPEATQDEKREIVMALRKQGKSDEQIRDTFQTVTGKKGSWLKSDIEKMRAKVKEGEQATQGEAENFLKELGG